MDPWSYWRDTLKSPKFILAPMVSVRKRNATSSTNP